MKNLKMEPQQWVAGHLTGGIGNRLFQHSAAAGLAKKWGRPVVFCLSECDPTNHGPFENIFKLFPTVPRISTAQGIQRLPEPKDGVFTYTAFPSEPVADYCSIDGWRQTELYFPKDGIHPDFSSALSAERRDALLKAYDLDSEEKRKSTWFLHVRLGDYKILPHHQIDMHSYYSQAVKHIPPNSRILLFSDEIEQFGVFLEGFLRQMGAETIQTRIPDELEALFVMSQCWGGAVVANSTFSWWGAYFAKQCSPPGYTAIYPGVWGKRLPEARDIVPSWGIRISNN